MQGLFLLIFLLISVVEIIIQIVSLVKLKKTNKAKHWNLLIGLVNANYISCALVYVFYGFGAVGFSEAFLSVFVCGFSAIFNTIFLIIGLHIKNKIQLQEITKIKSAKFNSIFVIILHSIIVIVLPLIITITNIYSKGQYIVNYLNNRYGNGNYKVVGVYYEYYNIGMISKDISGYYYKIKSDYMDGTFVVYIDDDINCIDYDYFLPVYYSEKLNLKYELKYNYFDKDLDYDFSEFDEYVSKYISNVFQIDESKYNIGEIYSDYNSSCSNYEDPVYNPNFYIVPSNNGKIPSIDEIINEYIKINVEKDVYYDIDN